MQLYDIYLLFKCHIKQSLEMKEKKEERHVSILTKIKAHRTIALTDLAEALHVSEHTIRRDLKELSDAGFLTAIRGGAIAKSSMPFNVFDRIPLSIEEKNIIADKAVRLLEPGQVVFFDGGTTTQAIAGNIPDHMKITVVTHSFPIANVLATHPNVKLIFAGGELCSSTLTTQGVQTIHTFEQVYADLCFSGICSIDSEKGVTARTSEEAEIKRVLYKHSEKLIAVTTSNKLDKSDAFFVSPANAIDFLITEKDPDNTDYKHYHQLGIQIL